VGCELIIASIKDYMASSASDLMFLEGDQITVLQELEHGKAFLVRVGYRKL
jgi:hypothetical protein